MATAKEMCRKAGLTHDQLAKSLRRDRSTITDILNEKAMPSLPIALLIARRVKSTVEDLFGHRVIDPLDEETQEINHV